MFKTMLIKGGILVAGMITMQAVIEKLERAELKRIGKSEIMESEEEVENTEEQLKVV